MLNDELIFDAVVYKLGAILVNDINEVLVFVNDFHAVIPKLDFRIGHCRMKGSDQVRYGQELFGLSNY